MKRNSLKTYAVVLLVGMIVITTVVVGVVFQSIERAADDGDVINAAGRQRMLSQAMGKSILGYNAAKSSIENTKVNVADVDAYITQMRGAYTRAVIGPAKASDLKVSMHPADEPRAAVPFPATFARMVNEKFAAKDGLSVDIISNHPINPNQSLKDATDEEAYRFLSKNPKAMFFRTTTEAGVMYLRFYTADVAVVQGCADCHTKMTGKPYKVGDMLGIRRFSLHYSDDPVSGQARLNPSLVEYKRASQVFSQTLAAFKSGGDYPADLAMTRTHYFAGSKAPDFQAKITEIERSFERFQADVAELDHARAGTQAHWDAQQHILRGSNELRALSDELTTMYATQAHANQGRIQWVVFVLALIVVAAFLGVYLFLTKGIIGPLHKAVALINNMAEGDLTKRLEVRRQDEVGHLAQMLNVSMNDIGGSIIAMNSSSHVLKDLATEMSDASQRTGEGVKRQVDEVRQAATAVTEMGATVQEMAQNTALAAQSTEQARDAAVNGQRVVSSTIDSINSLADEVKEAAEVIRLVEEGSGDINAILDTIRSIAEQTNLLALNAAIEAARAGEHGRGFSVVADEVRSLASRTQEATGEIQGMIETLQHRTHEAVETMNRGTETAEKSVAQAANANEALVAIVDGVGEISEMNLQIATAAEELSQVTQEIDANIVAVNEVSSQTAEQADHSYEASLRISMLSAEIGSLMKRFKIDEAAAREGRHVLFQWSEALDVGIEEVNRQHMILINIVNELYDLIQAERSGSAVRRVLDGLVDYTVNHFGYEEHLLEKFAYPDVAEHKQKHQALIEKVSDFVRRVDSGEDVSQELLEFLEAWLKKHIQGADKDYAQFLNTKGIR